MASLNTLRTKFGYVLSAVIAFALLAFIFSLKSDMGFSGNDPKVGEINSEDVLYSEYYTEYENVKRQSGATESTEEQAASLASAAWQSMISKKLIVPGLEELGLSVSEEERMAVVNGDIYTQTFTSAFTDPNTGVYNAAYIAQFLSQSAYDPAVDAAWAELNKSAREERSIVKYNALIRSGSYANKLEVAHGVNSANTSYSGKWVSVPYSSMPDSLFSISDAEIKKYYEVNKAAYKKNPTRTFSYVMFGFEPTEEDIISLENEVLAESKVFAAAEDLKQYVRANLNGSISQNYFSEAQLTPAQMEAFEAGEMFGPVNLSGAWTMARVSSKLMAPDSIGLSHIVLSYEQDAMADSLVTALKGGADFAQAARENSLYTQTAQDGGDIGVMPFSVMGDEFVAALSSAKKGDIVKIAAGDMIQILKVTRADDSKPHYQVATVEYPVEASQSTIAELHSNANMFSVAAKGGVDKFNGAADQSGVIVRTAAITAGDRLVRTITDSREIARWAYGAAEGEISDIFKTDGGYVVAMLTNIDDAEYRSLASVSAPIRSILLQDKKYAEIAKTMTGSTIEAVAEAVDRDVAEFAGVQFDAQYIPGMNVEPKVVGAITLSGVEGLTAPIQGAAGVYVLDVVSQPTGVDQTAEMERVRAQATVEDRSLRYVFNAVQDMGNIKDLRGEFF